MQAIRRILAAVKDTRTKLTPGILKVAAIARNSSAKLELFHAIDDPKAITLLKSSSSSPREWI